MQHARAPPQSFHVGKVHQINFNHEREPKMQTKLPMLMSLKWAVIQRQFLESVDELDFATLGASTPALVKMLQRYDRLFGLPPSSNSSCGVDVRLIFAVRKRFLPMNPQEQKRLMKRMEKFFFDRRQLQAIARPLRPMCGLEELMPLALMPVLEGARWWRICAANMPGKEGAMCRKKTKRVARLKRMPPKELADLKRRVLAMFFKAEGKLYPPKNLPKLRVIAGGRR
jgi:hypothetical protein